MTDNSLFSFGSDGQQPLVAADDVFRDRNVAGFGQVNGRQPLPPLSSYFNSNDVFTPLQVPHQPTGMPSGMHQVPSMQGYHQRPQNAVRVGNGHGAERQAPLTPPGSPDDQIPHRQIMDHNSLNNQHQDMKPNVSGMVAAMAGAGVTDPSIAPAIARALSHQSRSRGRVDKQVIPEDCKDDRYFERRKRNNHAAKKSRDTRKKREDEIAIRASFLEKENAILRAQVATLREEANSLRQLLLQKRSRP